MSPAFWWKLEILLSRLQQWAHERRLKATGRLL